MWCICTIWTNNSHKCNNALYSSELLNARFGGEASPVSVWSIYVVWNAQMCFQVQMPNFLLQLSTPNRIKMFDILVCSDILLSADVTLQNKCEAKFLPSETSEHNITVSLHWKVSHILYIFLSTNKFFPKAAEQQPFFFLKSNVTQTKSK